MSDFKTLHGTRLPFAFRMPVDSARAEECAGYCRPLSPRGRLWDWDWIYVDGRHLAQFRFKTDQQREDFATGAWLNLSGFQTGPEGKDSDRDHTLRTEP